MHRTLKTSLTAANHRDWAKQLPWILLQMRNAKGDDIDYSPTDMLFGGKTCQLYIASTDDGVDPNYFAAAMTAWTVPPPCPGRWHRTFKAWVPHDFKNIKHIYIRIAKKRPLRDAYAGPFEVTKWTDKTVSMIAGKKPLQ